MKTLQYTLTVLLVGILFVGCSKPAAEEPKEQVGQKAEQAPQPAKQNKGIIGKKTDDVADYQELIKENPNLTKVSDKVNEKSPLKQSMGILKRKGSQVSRFGMVGAIRAHKALHDKFPTYEEFMGIMKEHGVKFTQLPATEMYAYDSKTGEIYVLKKSE